MFTVRGIAAQELTPRHYIPIEGPLRFRGWLRRRLTHLVQYPVADGEIDIVIARFDWPFRDLPFLFAFVAIRVIPNSWRTSRRMTRMPGSCLYGRRR